MAESVSVVPSCLASIHSGAVKLHDEASVFTLSVTGVLPEALNWMVDDGVTSSVLILSTFSSLLHEVKIPVRPITVRSNSHNDLFFIAVFDYK